MATISTPYYSHNIVLSAGQNNVSEVDDFSKEEWSQKLDREIVIQTLKDYSVVMSTTKGNTL